MQIVTVCIIYITIMSAVSCRLHISCVMALNDVIETALLRGAKAFDENLVGVSVVRRCLEYMGILRVMQALFTRNL